MPIALLYMSIVCSFNLVSSVQDFILSKYTQVETMQSVTQNIPAGCNSTSRAAARRAPKAAILKETIRFGDGCDPEMCRSIQANNKGVHLRIALETYRATG